MKKPLIIYYSFAIALLGFELPSAHSAVSLQQAIQLLQSDNPPAEIEITPGEYTITEPIVITRSFAKPVRLFSRGNGATIHGGTKISDWMREKDGTYSATLPEGTQQPQALFINGKRAVPARHPNSGYLRIDQAAADNRTGFSFRENELPDLAHPREAKVVFMHDWSTSRIPIATIDQASHQLTTQFPIGCSAAHYAITHFEKQPRYFIEGARELLDAPGEWYFDQKERRLHYRPLEDQRVDSGIIPSTPQLLLIRGTDEQRVTNLTIENLTFSYASWTPPAKGYAAGQAGFHERRDGGPDHGLRQFIPPAVQVEMAEHCVFKKCSFTRLEGSGLWIGSRCTQIRVLESNFEDIAGNGLMIGEDNNRRVNGKSWWMTHPEQVSQHITVERNHIHHCGSLYSGCVGIWAGITQHLTIQENHIHHQPYTGISLGWMWSTTPTPAGNNRLLDNHIHHCMQVLSDGGGIYTLGLQPNSIIKGNTIHDIPLNLGRAESNGMFLDEGTTGFTIEENSIYNIDRSPLRFHKATTNLVRNNHLVVRPGQETVRYNNTKPADITLENNRVEIREHLSPASK